MSLKIGSRLYAILAVAGAIAAAVPAVAEAGQSNMAVGATVLGCQTPAAAESLGMEHGRHVSSPAMPTVCSAERYSRLVVSDSADMSEIRVAVAAPVPPSVNMPSDPEIANSQPRTLFVTFVY